MTEIRINGVPHKPVLGSSTDGISPDRLRMIVQDSHLNFLIGAGTPPRQDHNDSSSLIQTDSLCVEP